MARFRLLVLLAAMCGPTAVAAQPEKRIRLDGQPQIADAADVDSRWVAAGTRRSRCDRRSQRRELLDRALHSSERLVRLTNDILNLSKVEAGRMELHRSACRAADIIANACAAVAHLPYGADRVRVPNSEHGGELFVDADRIVQAVVNLLANGLKFTPPPGLVHVETRRHDTAVEIAVRDEGPGMTPEDLARLVQPFQQLASARKVGGTGLGLVISRAAVEQHGGQLTVDSRVGEGTTFTISLPLVPAG